MKNFKRIVKEISAMAISICSIASPASISYEGETPVEVTTEAQMTEKIRPSIVGENFEQGTAGYEVFTAMTFALKYPRDTQLWTNDMIEYYNTYWSSFFGDLLYIYQNSFNQTEFRDNFFNLIGFPVNHEEWSTGQIEEYATFYQNMYLHLYNKLPNMIDTPVETTTTTIADFVVSIETEVIPISTINISTETATIETTTMETYFTTETTTSENTTAIVSTSTTGDLTNTSISTVVTAPTTTTTVAITAEKTPQTGDKGIVSAIVALVGSVTALVVTVFMIKRNK